MNWSLIITLVISALVVATIVSVIVVQIISKGQSNLQPPGQESTGPTKNCPVISPFNNLVKCITDGDCKNCSGATLGYQCYNVTDKNPYKYIENSKSYNIPNGNWCLPTRVKTIQCNEWTGVPILTKTGDKEYQWSCECSKYPDWFGLGTDGNCTFETVCGYNMGDPSKSYGELVCPLDGIDNICKSGDSWLKNLNWDPNDGICKCVKGYIPVNTTFGNKPIKACTLDSCYPIGKSTTGIAGLTCSGLSVTGEKHCKCPDHNSSGSGMFGSYKTWIRCPDDVEKDKGAVCIENPKCLSDPCNPRGYFDSTVGNCKCICNDPTTKDKDITWTSEPANNIVGSICVNQCSESRNPCGDRGKCYYNKDTKESLCKNCKWPYYQDLSNLCKNKCVNKNYSCSGGLKCCKGLTCKGVSRSGREYQICL